MARTKNRKSAFTRLCQTWMTWRHEIGDEAALTKLETEYSEWSGIGELRQWTENFRATESRHPEDKRNAG
ncbi:MAG TPA: hypothetical protein PLX39_15415 [Pyrinomonadaceae bacterium]|nr:hypothetical protein [Pyrinomonadaceae bacterium]